MSFVCFIHIFRRPGVLRSFLILCKCILRDINTYGICFFSNISRITVDLCVLSTRLSYYVNRWTFVYHISVFFCFLIAKTWFQLQRQLIIFIDFLFQFFFLNGTPWKRERSLRVLSLHTVDTRRATSGI